MDHSYKPYRDEERYHQEAASRMEELVEELAVMEIKEDGDLSIRLYTTIDVGAQTFKSTSNGEPIPGKISMTVKVFRKVLIDSSEYFRLMFSDSRWMESEQSVMDIEYEYLHAMML